MSVSSRILYMKSIIVLLGAIMLLACKNDIKEVNALAEREKRPDMTGENPLYSAMNSMTNSIHGRVSQTSENM